MAWSTALDDLPRQLGQHGARLVGGLPCGAECVAHLFAGVHLACLVVRAVEQRQALIAVGQRVVAVAAEHTDTCKKPENVGRESQLMSASKAQCPAMSCASCERARVRGGRNSLVAAFIELALVVAVAARRGLRLGRADGDRRRGDAAGR